MMKRAWLGLSVACALSTAACAPSSSTPSSRPSVDARDPRRHVPSFSSGVVDSRSGIAKIHATRCGGCHVPPEPGSHSRADLEKAFARHQKRARLTHEEWREMVEFLATPDQQARVP
jgi:hypothetical protein